jgi:hypothetical protein
MKCSVLVFLTSLTKRGGFKPQPHEVLVEEEVPRSDTYRLPQIRFSERLQALDLRLTKCLLNKKFGLPA